MKISIFKKILRLVIASAIGFAIYRYFPGF